MTGAGQPIRAPPSWSAQADHPRLSFVNALAMNQAWVYILANRPHGTLYIGVTTNLPSRAHEHRAGLIDGFTRRYALTRLIHAEPHASITEAIRREKQLKTWNRAWKVRLIESHNPGWDDLYEQLAGGV